MARKISPQPADDGDSSLYLILKARIERLEGSVAQLLAESTRGSLQPTWKDFQALRAEIDALKAKRQP